VPSGKRNGSCVIMQSVECLTSKVLAGQRGVRHGFFTRQGGVSRGVYASLNCGPGSGDDTAHVAENRSRVMRALGSGTRDSDCLNTLAQVHSGEVIELREALPAGEHPSADALVTAIPGVAIGVLAADCVPVLFADTQGRVVAAAHAGWKGALGGILEATLESMGTLGAPAADIVACVGPCIQQQSYEVGDELRRGFLEADADNARYFRDSDRHGHFMFDLSNYVTHRVQAAGVADIERMRLDTYTDEQEFFSYRRATHRREPDYGRQLSVIALES